MIIDYLEETSLKLHVDIFNDTKITEEYILKQYKIKLFKNNDYIEYHIIDSSNTSYNNKFSYIVKSDKHNFELFLTLLNLGINKLIEQH